MQLLTLVRLLKNIKFALTRRGHDGSRFTIVRRFSQLQFDEVPAQHLLEVRCTIMLEQIREP